MMILTSQSFPPSSGGIENLMASLAHYAVLAGEKVHVFADGGADAVLYDRQSKPSYNITRFKGLKPLRRRLKSRRINKIASVQDYIFADSWKSIEHLPNSLSIPIIVYGHGNEYPRAKNSDSANPTYPKQARIREALSKATHLITVSQDTTKRVTPFLPAGLTPTMIHPPVAPSDLTNSQDLSFAQSLWPSRGVRLLVLCRLIELKGVDQALWALSQLLDEGTNAQLIIAGSGPDRGRLEALSAKLGLSASVVFAGRVEAGRKSALFDSADIFLQPGRQVGDAYEGFGITYLEAALHGLPTISGDAGGAPEATLNGRTGLVIDATVTENITEALRALISDKKLYTRMSAAAKAHGTAAQWPQQIQRILALKNR